jgi:hypothetical protein
VIRRSSTIAALVVCLAGAGVADDFKTLNGKEYKNATVSRQEPDGIIIKNAKAGLLLKLYFTELPKEIQERFGYDQSKAAAYQTQQNAALARAKGKEEAAQQQTDSSLVTGTSGGSGEHSSSSSGGGSVDVHGYYRKDGTYVHSYTRAAPGTGSHSGRRR